MSYLEKNLNSAWQSNNDILGVDGSQDFFIYNEDLVPDSIVLLLPEEMPATPPATYSSQFLIFENFNFDIPNNATIEGISVSNIIGDIGGIFALVITEYSILLSDSSDEDSTIGDLQQSHFSPASSGTIVSGSDSDDWGVDNLTPEIINSSGFGLRRQYFWDDEPRAESGFTISMPVMTIYYSISDSEDESVQVVSNVAGIFKLQSPTLKVTGTSIDGTKYNSTEVDVSVLGPNNGGNSNEIISQPKWENSVFLGEITVELESVYPEGNYPIPNYKNRIFSGTPKFGNTNAEIYYTLNGENPTRSSRLYRQPLVVKSGLSGYNHVILKYIVFYKGKFSYICRRDFYISPDNNNIYNFDEEQQY